MTTLLQRGFGIFPYLEEMQSTGMPVSVSHFTNLYDELTQRMIDIGRDISDTYLDGKSYNPNSRPQTAKLVASQGIKLKGKTKTGAISTSKGNLEQYRYTNEAVAKLFNWREVGQIRDKFCRAILDAVPYGAELLPGWSDDQPDIFSLRGKLKWTRTPTRRLAMEKTSNGINLLNMSKRESKGDPTLAAKVRTGFKCPSNEMLSAFDYSQMELRVLAHLSQDALMCKLFRSGADFHSVTASKMFGVPIPELDKIKHRVPGKTINFLTGYGGGAKILLEKYQQLGLHIKADGTFDLSITEEKAQGDLDRWYETFPGVTVWKDRVCSEARRKGYAETHDGMRRYLPALRHSKGYERAKAEREAISQIVQGTAQDMIQNAMRWIYLRILELREMGYHVWCALQMHDELLFRHEPDVYPLLEDIVTEGLENHHGVRMSVPVLSDGGTGYSWGEL